MIFGGLVRTQKYLRYDPEIILFGKKITQLTEEDALLVVGGWKRGEHLQGHYPPRNPINFYFSHRKGWEIDLDEWSIALVESLKQQGARYFVSYYPMGLDIKKEFAQQLRSEYKLLEASDRWFIYALD